MQDNCWLTAKEASRRMREGSLTAADLVEACLDRAAARECAIHAFIHLDPEAAFARGRHADGLPESLALRGIPFGVKDILDTANVPTAYGSSIWSGYVPRADSAAVALARRAGAVMIGKTVTTEFATMTPGPTRNPANPLHTPGGSSSGSAAGVADGFFPLAYGTQTAGSIIRPAAFCGVVGYKPTFGTIHRAGMKVMSESLDTIGVFARTVSDCALFVGAVAGVDLGDPDTKRDRAPRLAACVGVPASVASAAVAAFLDRAALACISKGADVTPMHLPAEGIAAFERHFEVMYGEAVQALAWERSTAADQISAALRERLDWGAALAPGSAAKGRAALHDARIAFQPIFESFDAIIAPSAPGEAPNGLGSTGDPAFNQLWTALHGPCVTVPAGHGPNGLPLGIQIIGAPGRDHDTLAIAEWVRAAIA